MRDLSGDWQVEVQGQIYVADFEELKQWIAEGAVLPSDRVKRGELRWLAAEKVPELHNLFDWESINNAASHNDSATEFTDVQPPFATDMAEEIPEWSTEKVCHLHGFSDAVYACDVCRKYFCKTCPKSYGGTVRLCPLCDSLCRAADEPVDEHKSVGAINKPYSRVDEITGKNGKQSQSDFQKSDITKAFVYPLKYLKNAVSDAKISISSHLNKNRR